MRVILLADVERLGRRGDVVSVRDGYARNFLFPRRLAMPGTAGNIAQIESIRTQLNDRHELVRRRLLRQAEQLDRVTLKAYLKMGAEGAFGAVTAGDIVSLLAEQGHRVDKHAIVLEEPIRVPGVYDIAVKLGHEVTATVKLWVVETAA